MAQKGFSYLIEFQNFNQINKYFDNNYNIILIKNEIDEYKIEKFNNKLPNSGILFSEKAEIRFEKINGNYKGILFTEENYNDLNKIDEYEVDEEIEISLQNLNEKSISPQFKEYPNKKVTAKLLVNVYKKNGFIITYRLRSIK